MDSDAAAQEGVLVSWDDERGFGYIQPEAGGHRVFAHIHAWPRGAGRPKEGDFVTFDVELAPDGRTRARSVRRPFETLPRQRVTLGAEGYFAILGFIGLYIVVGTYWPVSPWIGLVYAVLSVASIALYTRDKAAAGAGSWRTSENTLHMVSLFGGWPGAILAQQLLHHKNRKESFQATFWTTVVVNCAAFVVFSRPVTELIADVVG
ncbi:DUF1294 domain-containing protein [Parafrigoribacterium soli]|uniref:DUF1294 domain-containing protein n=1 Tax=Parafrigoribacterium soli TaxID=3144663 RepID=UPI0032ECF67D